MCHGAKCNDCVNTWREIQRTVDSDRLPLVLSLDRINRFQISRIFLRIQDLNLLCKFRDTNLHVYLHIQNYDAFQNTLQSGYFMSSN